MQASTSDLGANIPNSTDGTEVSRPVVYTIDQLKDNASLWYGLHVFMYDLRHFAYDKNCEDRLNIIWDPCYLGKPYFNGEETEGLKKMIITTNKCLKTLISDTIETKLNRRARKREDSGDHRVRSAHDLAPLFEKAFDIRPKDLDKEPNFQRLLGEYGLDLPAEEEFTSLRRKKGILAKQQPKKGQKS